MKVRILCCGDGLNIMVDNRKPLRVKLFYCLDILSDLVSFLNSIGFKQQTSKFVSNGLFFIFSKEN